MLRDGGGFSLGGGRIMIRITSGRVYDAAADGGVFPVEGVCEAIFI